MKLLVTGFLPFLGQSVNPSEEIARDLSREFSAECLVLPVSFKRAPLELERLMNERGPFTHILQLGQAGGRSKISLERVALNWIETPVADEDGDIPKVGKILEQQPDALINFHLKGDWAVMIQEHAPCEISYSAGTFVCNTLYFISRARFPQAKILFAHLPFIPEQSQTEPALPLSRQKLAIHKLITLFTA